MREALDLLPASRTLELVHPLLRLHHAGIACSDIEQTRSWIHSTHEVTEDSGVVWDPQQEADLCLMDLDGGAIELVSGPVVADLLKRGHTLYHLCYEVGDIDDAIDRLERSGCRLVSRPVPAILFGGRRVAFMYGPTGLVELLEV